MAAEYFSSDSSSSTGIAQPQIRHICRCGNCNVNGIESSDPILSRFVFLQNEDYISSMYNLIRGQEIYSQIEAIFAVETDSYLNSKQHFLRMLIRDYLSVFSEEEIYNGIGQFLIISYPENSHTDMNIVRELIYIKVWSEQQVRQRQYTIQNYEEKYDSDDIPSDIPALIPPIIPAPAAASASSSNSEISQNNMFDIIRQIYQQIQQAQQSADQPLDMYDSFLNNKVLRTLSKEELEAKNPLMLFSQVEEKIKQMNNSCCTICQEDFVNSTAADVESAVESDVEVRQLICGHLFHTACVDEWLTRHDFHCPLCRTSCGIHKCDV